MKTRTMHGSHMSRRAGPWVREGLFYAAVVIVLVLALPLAVALALTARLAFFGGLALVAVGGIVFAVSPTFRDWLTGRSEGKVSYQGIRLASDVALDSGHGWARVEGREMVVGADDLVQTALGPVEAVDLPPPGTRVRRHEPLFRLRHGSRTVEVRSPVSGSVVGTNRQLGDKPGLVNEAPFTRGWVARIRSEDEAPRRQRKKLLRGRHAKAWLREEVDHLLALLVGSPAGVPCLPDGGVLVDELHRHIDDATWQRLKDAFFEVEEDEAS